MLRVTLSGDITQARVREAERDGVASGRQRQSGLADH